MTNTTRQYYQIISDIHIPDDEIPNWSNYLEVSAPYLIIAGDVGRIEKFDKYSDFIKTICTHYKQVFLVAGNHEFYSDKEEYEFLNMKLIKLSSDIPNLTYLNNDYVDMPGNIRIYGCTLWSYTDKNTLPKILPIKLFNYNHANSDWINMKHFYEKYHLIQAIYNANKQNKRLIVVTHYPPTKQKTVTEEHLQTSDLNWYANDMDNLLTKNQVYIWIYGHTHVNTDYLTKFDTRVVSNQVLGNNFVKNKVISFNSYQNPLDTSFILLPFFSFLPSP